MKNSIIALSLISILSSCGSDNRVSSGVSGTNPVEPPKVVNFQGNYSLLRASSNECAYNVQIIQDCSGYIVLNDNGARAEEFCNINKGAFRSREQSESMIVTQEANVIQSSLSIGPRTFTHTLKLENDRILTKTANLKSRSFNCVYEKR